ncbi:MAG: hypothetical protein ACTSQE_07015 [Candidatus Heimdallarchaeaceae archaeon]
MKKAEEKKWLGRHPQWLTKRLFNTQVKVNKLLRPKQKEKK